MKNKNWNDNSIQFPRLIAEIVANCNINERDFTSLCESMDLSGTELTYPMNKFRGFRVRLTPH